MNYIAPILGRSTDKGAETVIYLARSPQVEGVTGNYFSDKEAVPTSEVAQDLQAEIILGNTYHLYQRPGLEVLTKASGLHSFMH